jgi:amino acid adenylation domain-containing protein
MDIIAELRDGLIVSCQAPAYSPLHAPEVIAAMAQASVQHGAVAVRVDTPQHIAAVRQRLQAPVIGLWKRQLPAGDVVITPRFAEAVAVAAAGADMIALDATLRPRADGATVATLIARIHDELGKAVVADVDTIEAAITAAQAGADVIATTLYGYTAATWGQRLPAWQLLSACVQRLAVPVLCEGGVDSPALAQHALELGAHAVVVGRAITGIEAQVHTYATTLAASRSWRGHHTDRAASPGSGTSQAAPFVPFRREDVEQSIPARFEQQVARYPERVAIQSQDRQFTYAALNQAANRLAHAILARECQGTEPVVVLLHDETLTIIAILAVLKAGQSYVPLDPTLPPARMAYILEDTQARLLITTTTHEALAEALAPRGCHIINMDRSHADAVADNPGLAIGPDTCAQVLYTSGSTGQPKGVMQTHGNLLHLIRNTTNDFRITADDRISHLTPTAVTRTFGALLNGATFLPFDVKQEGLSRLAAWLRQADITLYYFVPTAFRQFLHTLAGAQALPRLRLICLSGETVQPRDVALFRQYFSADTLLVNGLGTTETGSIARYVIDRQTPIGDSLVPVGYAVDDVDIRVVDELGRAVAPGQLGEIVVRSRYLSLGYWRQPALTEQVFMADPDAPHTRVYRTGDLGRLSADGCLQHLGRKDFQVKIRGQRVEVAEIEMALLALGTVKETVVVALHDTPEAPRLIAYLVPYHLPGPASHELRHALQATLPDYMLPSAFVRLDRLPLTSTGKVDRQALPAPDANPPALVQTVMAPRSPLEATLARIWAAVLGQEQVGSDHTLLDLGGHSLHAARIIAGIREAFGVEVSLRQLWDAPTVAGLARVIVQHHIDRADDTVLAQTLAAIEHLSETQIQQQLATDLYPEAEG